MRTILFILQKEFIQIFRNKTMLPIIFVLPVVQLIVLVYAATLDMKHINLFVVDKDMSTVSRQLTSKFQGSEFFYIGGVSGSLKDAESEVKKNNADIILHIPYGFEKRLVKENHADLQLLINAINGTAAGLTNAYASSVIYDFNNEIRVDWINSIDFPQAKQINLTTSFWYNPLLDYKKYMLPGILVILVTVIGMFLTALNLVREKEIGTIEQINVTPIKKYQFLIGKLTPFLIIALFELGFGLIVGKLLFEVPMVGSLLLLFGVATLYLLVALGIGLFISTITDTQQQVMFLSFFFMLVFILISGLFTSVESMPDWAQKVNIINPFAYFIKVIRMILLKGSEAVHITKELISLSIYAIIILMLSVWRYRKIS